MGLGEPAELDNISLLGQHKYMRQHLFILFSIVLLISSLQIPLGAESLVQKIVGRSRNSQAVEASEIIDTRKLNKAPPAETAEAVEAVETKDEPDSGPAREPAKEEGQKTRGPASTRAVPESVQVSSCDLGRMLDKLQCGPSSEYVGLMDPTEAHVLFCERKARQISSENLKGIEKNKKKLLGCFSNTRISKASGYERKRLADAQGILTSQMIPNLKKCLDDLQAGGFERSFANRGFYYEKPDGNITIIYRPSLVNPAVEFHLASVPAGTLENASERRSGFGLFLYNHDLKLCELTRYEPPLPQTSAPAEPRANGRTAPAVSR